MAIRCIFFLPGQPQPCQVLQAARAAPLPEPTRERLERVFCHTGAFLNCPIFQRVEQGLSVMGALQRSGPPLPPDPPGAQAPILSETLSTYGVR